MDLSAVIASNDRDHVIKSSIPDKTQSEGCILGIDEAGRGPVLGPMVYGICYCPLSCQEKLKEMKFADSKTLSEQQREELFASLDQAKDTFGWMLKIISPNVISNSMLSRCKYNLNAISHDAAISLVKHAIDDGVKVEEVYVDTVGDATKYQDKLSEQFPGVKITVSKKADSLFPIVSAASICAKVARDRALHEWKFEETLQLKNESWGSGYPNDPDTKKFLTDNCDKIFGFPQLVRFSWSTADTILEKNAASVEWEEVNEDGTTSNAPTLFSYFARKPSAERERKLHPYWTERNLKPVTSLL